MTLHEIFWGTVSPFFYWIAPNQRLYWVYLATAFLLAACVYAVHRQRSGSTKSFLQYCFPKDVYLHKSAITDYKYYVVNRIAFVFLFTPLIVGTELSSSVVTAVLSGAFPTSVGAFGDAGWIAMAFLTVGVVFAHDFSVFYTHLLQHRIPVLWEFHKVHHSAEVLTPITVYRMHPVDDIFTGWLVGLTTGAVYGVFAHLFTATPSELMVNGLNVVLFVFYVAGFNLRHTHIWLPYTGIWGRLLVSPAHHQIHHGTDPRYYDRNYGLIFAFWDWMAGSLYVPEPHQEIEFGLGPESEDYRTVWRLYTLPFVKVLHRLRGTTLGEVS